MYRFSTIIYISSSYSYLNYMPQKKSFAPLDRQLGCLPNLCILMEELHNNNLCQHYDLLRLKVFHSFLLRCHPDGHLDIDTVHLWKKIWLVTNLQIDLQSHIKIILISFIGKNWDCCSYLLSLHNDLHLFLACIYIRMFFRHLNLLSQVYHRCNNQNFDTLKKELSHEYLRCFEKELYQITIV